MLTQREDIFRPGEEHAPWALQENKVRWKMFNDFISISLHTSLS